MSDSPENNKKPQNEGCLSSHTAGAGAAGRELTGAMAGPVKRGPGRPPGAQNKAANLAKRVAARYGMRPGDLLAESLMGSLPEYLASGGNPADYLSQHRAAEIALDLGITRLEAMAILQDQLKALLPLTEQKLPVLDEQADKAVIFQAVDQGGAAAPRQQIGGRDLRPADVRMAENEAGSDGSGRTEGEKPHD